MSASSASGGTKKVLIAPPLKKKVSGSSSNDSSASQSPVAAQTTLKAAPSTAYTPEVTSAAISGKRKKAMPVLRPPVVKQVTVSSSATHAQHDSQADSSTSSTPATAESSASPATAVSTFPYDLHQRSTGSSSHSNSNTNTTSSSNSSHASKSLGDEEFLRAVNSIDSHVSIHPSSSTVDEFDELFDVHDEELFPDYDANSSSRQMDRTSFHDSTIPSTSSSNSDAAASASRWTKLVSWASLLIAVFSMAAVGPVFLYLEKRGVPAIIAIVWRQTCQTMFLLPPTIYEYFSTPVEARDWWNQRVQHKTPEEIEMEKKRKLAKRRKERQAVADALSGLPFGDSRSNAARSDQQDLDEIESEQQTAAVDQGSHPYISLFHVSCSWAISVGAWVIALPFTSAARASLFSSLYPIMIMGYMKFARHIQVSAGEFVGVILSLCGIAVTEFLSSMSPDANTMQAAAKAAQDAASGLTNSTATNSTSTITPVTSSFDASSLSLSELQLVGDALCIFASVFIAINVMVSSPTRRVVPLFAFSFLTSIMVWFMLVFTSWAIGEGIQISTHPTLGLFGWMATKEMAVRMLIFGFVVGMIGILGFNFSVKYVNPIVFSTVQLLDAGITAVMSAVAGVEGWPVPSTYVGMGVVTAGIFFVVYFQQKREDKEKAETNYQLVELTEIQ